MCQNTGASATFLLGSARLVPWPEPDGLAHPACFRRHISKRQYLPDDAKRLALRDRNWAPGMLLVPTLTLAAMHAPYATDFNIE